MSTDAEIAAILYPSSSQPTRPSAATAPSSTATVLYSQDAAGASPRPAQAPANQTQQPARVAPQEASGANKDEAANALYGLGSTDAAASYDPALSTGFDALEYQARFDGNAEDTAALREGRKESESILREWGASDVEAKGLAASFSEYATREPLSDEAVDQANQRTEATLRAEWGDSYAENLTAARSAYQAACARLWWLPELIERGPGSQVDVVRHFASLGKRRARKAGKK